MLLRVEDAAQRLNISRSMAYELCHRPDFPAVWINRHCVRVSEAALEDWIAAQLAPRKGRRDHAGME